MKAELRNEVLHIPGLTNHLRAYAGTRARARALPSAGEYSRSSLPGVRFPADPETFRAASLDRRVRKTGRGREKEIGKKREGGRGREVLSNYYGRSHG